METVRCQEKRMKFRKFVFWNIFRLEATADEIDVNKIPSAKMRVMCPDGELNC